MISRKLIGEVIEAEVYSNPKFTFIGEKIGRLYTDYGLPVDMALSRLSYSKQEKLKILNGACGWLIKHKRNSSATEKSIKRQRKSNRRALESFIKTGESGLY